MALTSNPLFSKESMKKATSSLGWASYTLCYDNNDLPEQEKAGKELLQAKWILATISSHVFDYYPVEYYLADEEHREYLDFYNWFMEHMSVGLRNALEFVENDYAVLETITRDKWNQHRVPVRKPDEEAHVKALFEALIENSDELFVLLNSPKKVNDAEKPSAELIRGLIDGITVIQESCQKYADAHPEAGMDAMQVFQFQQSMELFKNPLRQAWQVYHYGWHSDFWEEGDSMFEYMMYEVKAKEMLQDLVKSLSSESLFDAFPGGHKITEGLLKVYKHLLTQDLSGE